MACKRATFFMAAAGLALLTGCSDGRPARVPVSGQVLIDGQPLTRGYVMFAPANSRPSAGQLDAEGRFRLTCYEPGDGAVMGHHKVAVISKEPINDETVRWHAPKKYADASSSGLEQEITGPTDSIKIEITWGGVKGPIVERF